MKRTTYYHQKLWIWCLPLLALFIFTNSNAQTNTIEQVGREYLKAYQSGNINKMEALLDENAVMIDLTASIMGAEMKLEGRSNIVQTLGGMFKAVEGLHHESLFEFTNGNIVVSGGYISYTGTLPNKGKKKLRFKIVTVLKLAGNKVIEHRDYADYQSMLKQF